MIDVLTLDGDKIAASTGFMAADLFSELPSPPDLSHTSADTTPAAARGSLISGAQLFARFGLPPPCPN